MVRRRAPSWGRCASSTYTDTYSALSDYWSATRGCRDVVSSFRNALGLWCGRRNFYLFGLCRGGCPIARMVRWWRLIIGNIGNGSIGIFTPVPPESVHSQSDSCTDECSAQRCRHDRACERAAPFGGWKICDHLLGFSLWFSLRHMITIFRGGIKIPAGGCVVRGGLRWFGTGGHPASFARQGNGW